MSTFGTPMWAAAAILVAMAAAGAVAAEAEPDAQTRQTMQAWESADQACRTTLAQAACQDRRDTWNWLFQRGWRRNAKGEFFQLEGLQEPLPGLSGSQIKR